MSPPAEDIDQLAGSLIDGRYHILEVMAAGSMGAVYKAERVPVGKLFAIKFLHAEYAKEGEFKIRFERETRAMSKLAHPNCVSVVDFGVFEGKPYVVMDHVTGITLRRLIDRERSLPPNRALAIARQIAAGLAHAHEQGIVHRDIKPANIMVSDEIGTGERVRILDFGLARLRDNPGRDATQNNVVVGTPNYMAPEQTVGGGAIDARTDIYALGVVIFEMLSGERPYASEETLALLGMHRAAPIPRLADRAGLDQPELQRLIDTAMAKAPSDRYQTAIEFADAIERAAAKLEGSGPVVSSRVSNTIAIAPTIEVATHTAEPRPRRGMFPKILLLGVLGGGAAGAWYLTQREPDRPPSEPVVITGDAGQLPAIDAAALAVAIDGEVTPDSELASLAADASEPADALVAALEADGGELVIDGGEPIAVHEPDPATADNPAPKPDREETIVEASDEPKRVEDVDKRPVAPEPPKPPTLQDALALIKEGKGDPAIAALRELRKSNPKSAYIPFLLGNLYVDKGWWTVALGEYRTTIDKNAEYKKNPTLIRNAIRMFGSQNTVAAAKGLLTYKVGKPAIPYLRQAAANSGNGNIKWHAAATLRTMGVKP